MAITSFLSNVCTIYNTFKGRGTQDKAYEALLSYSCIIRKNNNWKFLFNKGYKTMM